METIYSKIKKAIELSDVNALKILISKESIQLRNEALITCVTLNQPECLAYLLKKLCNSEYLSNSLIEAMNLEYYSCVELLIPKIKKNPSYLLADIGRCAILKNNMKVLIKILPLIEQAKPRSMEFLVTHLISWGVKIGRLEMFNLLKDKAPPLFRKEILEFAIQGPSLEIFKMVLKRSEPKLNDSKALTLAVMVGKEELVDLLFPLSDPVRCLVHFTGFSKNNPVLWQNVDAFSKRLTTPVQKHLLERFGEEFLPQTFQRILNETIPNQVIPSTQKIRL